MEGTHLGEDVSGFLSLVVEDEPSWSLWHEDEADEHDERGDTRQSKHEPGEKRVWCCVCTCVYVCVQSYRITGHL